MAAPLPDLAVVALRGLYSDRAGRLDVFHDGDDRRLRDAVSDAADDAAAPVALDLHGLVYLGYSFAKHTVVRLLHDADGPVVAVGPDDPTFLDGLADALTYGRAALYLAPTPRDVGRSGRAIGATTPTLDETFRVLLRLGPLGTGDLAAELDTSPQNAKNRVDRLVELGLATRLKVSSPSGGMEWLNRLAVMGG